MRQRNIGRGKRRLLNTSKAVEINCDISDLFHNPTISNAHSVIHLSKRQWKRMKDNSIHMSDMHKVNGIHVYNNIKFGRHINKITYKLMDIATNGDN